jgi:hypothetical protein
MSRSPHYEAEDPMDTLPNELLWQVMCGMDWSTLVEFSRTHRRAAAIFMTPEFERGCLLAKRTDWVREQFAIRYGNPVQIAVERGGGRLGLRIRGTARDGTFYEARMEVGSTRTPRNIVQGMLNVIPPGGSPLPSDDDIAFVRWLLELLLLEFRMNYRTDLERIAPSGYRVGIFIPHVPTESILSPSIKIEGPDIKAVMRQFDALYNRSNIHARIADFLNREAARASEPDVMVPLDFSRTNN